MAELSNERALTVGFLVLQPCQGLFQVLASPSCFILGGLVFSNFLSLCHLKKIDSYKESYKGLRAPHREALPLTIAMRAPGLKGHHTGECDAAYKTTSSVQKYQERNTMQSG